MKLTELKLLCRSKGLRANGKKSILIKRLQDYIEQQKQVQQQQEVQLSEHKNKIESKAPEVQQSSITNTMSTLLISTSTSQTLDATGTSANVLRQPAVCEDVEMIKSYSSSKCDTHNSNDNDYDVNDKQNGGGMYQYQL